MPSFFSFKMQILAYIILTFIFVMLFSRVFTPIIKHIIYNITPVPSVSAKIVSKRQKIFSMQYDDSLFKINYYITFNIENDNHFELRSTSSQYDSVFPGDTGKLTFRGKKLVSFVLK